MLQTVAKISGSKTKAFSRLCIASFSSSDKGDKGDAPNPFPKNLHDLPDKQPTYHHNINYNFEEFRKYTKDVKEAIKLREQDEDLELKIKSKDLSTVPRRQRRVYAAPKYDVDITNYAAWRVFDRDIPKLHQFSLPVVCKIPLAPKYLKKVLFGVNI